MTSPASEPLGMLGRYELVRVLGRGAMGVVYEGLDLELQRTVAIKTILGSHLLDPREADEYRARFRREAQAAGRLTHPHIVTVFDFGIVDDGAYLVMQFVRGRELATAFASGERYSLAESVRIMCELLDALGYAHEHGVVHRDVKPANVMLDQHGTVKLTDFGVARLAEAGTDRTMPGTIVGTPSYMSPEQILGHAVGSRADLFAAGVILYQFLTGKRPFAADGAFAVQYRIVNEPAEPPSTLVPGLAPVWDAIVARALAKKPEDRYADASSFGRALYEALGPEASSAQVRTIAAPPLVPAAPREPSRLPAREPSREPPREAAREPSRAPTHEPSRATAAPRAPAAAPAAMPAHTAPEPLTIDLTQADPATATTAGLARSSRRSLGVALVALAGAGGAAWWWARPPAGIGVATPTPAPPTAAPPAAPLPSPQPAPLPPASPAPAPTPAPVAAPQQPPVAASAAAERPPAAPPPRAVERVLPPVPAPAPAPDAPAPAPAPAPRPAAAPPARPVPRADNRCAALLERWQIGEPLSADDQAYFDSRCKR